MRVSQQVLEWQAEAEVKLQRANVRRLLQNRCKTPVPSDLAERIETTQDMNLLLLWFDAASEAKTYDDFRAAIEPRS